MEKENLRDDIFVEKNFQAIEYILVQIASHRTKDTVVWEFEGLLVALRYLFCRNLPYYHTKWVPAISSKLFYGSYEVSPHLKNSC